MSVSLDAAVSSLLTNRRRVGALKSLGIVTVRDALTYYPFRVADPVPVRPLRQAAPGVTQAFAASVEAVRVTPMNARRGFRLEAIVRDDDGMTAMLVFFAYRKSYVDWVGMRLRQGARVVVTGMPSSYNGRMQFTHPEILTVDPWGGRSDDAALSSSAQSTQPVQSVQSVQSAQSTSAQTSSHAASAPVQQYAALKYDASTEQEALRRVNRPRPVYHANSRISSEHIHETIMGFLNDLDAASVPDIIPEPLRERGDYLHRLDAFRAVHDPDTAAQFLDGLETLRYEEALVCQTALVQSRRSTHATPAYPCGDGRELAERFIASLPFTLTGGQRSVIDDVQADMALDRPMQRLLQGEVGSGKTVVAVAAMLGAVGAGKQAVIVAPTLVLAEQHADTIRGMLERAGIDAPVVLLTGSMKLSARRKALATAASGEPCIVVATHAAFSKTFQAPNLALAVIDEQHRFGVEQRETLRKRADVAPHLLVMTATPIPRTAAMTWFGDLDISWLTELPGGRKPIRTFVVPEADSSTMARMFAHIRARIDAGERAYVVCPRIDEDDDDGEADGAAFMPAPVPTAEDGEQRPPAHSVAEIAERLAALPQFAGVRFATLSGRDKDDVKAQVMAGFASGETPVLVSTTVIEVGVDVPQASCIVIFDADRFGLAQLHQLRGRVGRGGTDSWAFLVTRAQDDPLSAQRLEVIRGTLDGAEIAQADLELRGAGDVLGDVQSGVKSSLKLLRVVKDAKVIEQARGDAQRLLDADDGLRDEPQLAGAALDFTRGNEAFLGSN